MVPIKNGPNIKLKSLITLFIKPPFTVHHLKGTENIQLIATNKEAKIATGEYFLNTFFGIKKTVNHGINNRPILIIVANIIILLSIVSFILLTNREKYTFLSKICSRSVQLISEKKCSWLA
jgi:hypothetical protein